jgi:hypothetical protein
MFPSLRCEPLLLPVLECNFHFHTQILDQGVALERNLDHSRPILTFSMMFIMSVDMLQRVHRMLQLLTCHMSYGSNCRVPDRPQISSDPLLVCVTNTTVIAFQHRRIPYDHTRSLFPSRYSMTAEWRSLNRHTIQKIDRALFFLSLKDAIHKFVFSISLLVRIEITRTSLYNNQVP